MLINHSFDCNNRQGYCDIKNLFCFNDKKTNILFKTESDKTTILINKKMKEDSISMTDKHGNLISTKYYDIDYNNQKIILKEMLIDEVLITYEEIVEKQVLPNQIAVEFYFNWTGRYNVMPFSFENYGLIFYREYFGFTTGNNDVYGISALKLERKWHHVYAVFNIDDITKNQIYIDGELKICKQRTGIPIMENLKFTNNAIIGCNYLKNCKFDGLIDEFRIWDIIKTNRDIKLNMENLIYENSSNYDNLIAYYRFDEQDAKIKDYSKNNRTIYMTGGIFSTDVPNLTGYNLPQNILILNPVSEIKKNSKYKMSYKIIPPTSVLSSLSEKLQTYENEDDTTFFITEIDKTEWDRINDIRVW